MEDSSYNVKPELYHEETKVELNYIESVKHVTKQDKKIKITTNINKFFITLYEHGIIRFTTSDGDFEFNHNFYLEPLEILEFDNCDTSDQKTVVSYQNLGIVISHQPFLIRVYKDNKLKYRQKAIAFENHQSYLFFDRNLDDFIYGLGEKTGFLNKNNEKTVNWNKDVFEPHTRSNKELYLSINMFSYMNHDYKYGLFVDNPGKVTFDFDTNEIDGIVQCDTGILDYYLYTDDTLKGIVRQHAMLTGKTYLPPLWALGYHQSRHSYESTKKLVEVYQNFKNRDIPVDAIYLDILYMDKYKVFTFNKKTFKDIEDVIQMLKEDGVKIVPIVDPGVKIEKGYSIYDESIKKDLYCKKNDLTVFKGEVWPGDCIFYDFLNERIREEWGNNHKFYTDMGIEGIWNDMNEPTIFNAPEHTMDLSVLHHIEGNEMTHKEAHNLYGLGMTMATYNGLKKLINKRPFVLTRAGYAGVQKYATVWTGDNRSSWEHLEMAIPMCLNLSMSGVALSGPDIGGFMDDCHEELLIRWTQLGTFLPFFRNHSSIGMKRQEPWQFGKRCEDITRRFIKLRYATIRYLYSEVFKSHLTGIPVMRPLVLDYEEDANTHSIHDQFLVGDHLLVAPILRPGETCRKVYLPIGTWFNFFTNEKVEGGKHYIIHAKLDEIPVFVKENAVIPMTTPKGNTEKLTNEITLNIYTNNQAFTDSFIVDDGFSFNYQQGDYTTYNVNYENEQVEVNKNGKEDFQIKLNIIKA